MHVTTCPDLTQLKKLVSGHLPPPDVETLIQHLETCPDCMAKVPGLSTPPDTLVELLAKAKTPPPGWQDPVIARLIDRLMQMKRGPAAGPKMLVFACPTCGKNMKAGADLAGKKVKCPGCAKVVSVPAQPQEAPQNLSGRQPDVGEKTLPPRHASLGNPGSLIQGIPLSEYEPMAQGYARETFDFLAPPQQPDELGRLGVYRVLKVLGAGGMGVVFKAEDPGLKRLVAIKAMLPAVAASASAKTRFQREAQAAAAIKHNHIVTIFQVTEDRGVPFLAMEFLEGEPLDSRLKREGRLPMAEVMRIGREMAEGMAAAHERGLIHRDIKPANTWLEGKKGHVKILDFGLARATDDQANLTQSGAIIGTPAYMAPEQTRGEKLDARCDLWSLGVVLYCMCTGELPFKGTDTISTLMAVAMNEPPPPAQVNAKVPPGLSELVMKLLEKDPAKRFGSAGEVVQSLEILEKETAMNLVLEKETVRDGLVGRVAPAERRSGPGAVRGRSGPRRGLPLATAVALLILLPLAWFFGGTVVRIATNKGELIIENDDPNIEVTIKDKTATVYDKVKDRRFVLTAGDYDVEVREEGDGGLRLATKKFTITRGGRETFHARLELAKAKLPEDKKDAAKLPTEPKLLEVDAGGGVKMKLILIEPGKFMMGSPKSEGADVNQEKQHEVEITNRFYMGVFAVTQQEYEQVMGKNPSQFRKGGLDTARFPVEFVSWNDAVEFCKKLSEKTGKKFDLPTEAEWEYACRAGTKGPFHFGDSLSSEQANFDGNRPYGGAAKHVYLARPAEVGSYKANAFGLFDMHGNVWQWCKDAYSVKFYSDSPARDPFFEGAKSDSCVLRGGCWRYPAADCRSAFRGYGPRDSGYDVGGFRVVLRPPFGDLSAVKPPAESKRLEVDVGGGVKMKLVHIEPGKFTMGSPKSEGADYEIQEKQHEVEITRPFYMGVYTVTQQEYEQVMGKNPSLACATGAHIDIRNRVAGLDTTRFPVENVSWNDAMEFCKKLSQRTGKEFDLPTEAEWEYACRGGTKGPFHFGDSLSSKQANFNGDHPFDAAAKAVDLKRTAKVGSYEANPFGLFDMHGNVRQWCKDYYKVDYYKDSPVKDPQGPADGKDRVLRGGHFDGNGHHCRSAHREWNPPGAVDGRNGFRVVVRLP